MILLTTILVLPLMLIFAGIAVDVAAVGQRDAELQTCADAAATAAASSTYWVPPEPPETEGHWDLDIAQASTYHVLNCPGATLAAPTATGQPPVVRVAVSGTSETSFLKILGIQQLAVAAVAEAVRKNTTEAERPDAGRSRLVK